MKFATITFLVSGALLLAACNEENAAQPAEVKTEESTPVASDPNVMKNESGTFTTVKLGESSESATSGPFVVSNVKAATMDAKFAPEVASAYGAENVQYVHVELDIAHNTDATDTIWGSFIKVVTNTGEQIDPDIALSKMIDGDFHGKVKQTGSYVYVLQNSNPEDVEWVRVLIDAPLDANNNTIGEPFDMRVNIQ